jgi:hypothetical protein
MRVCSPKVTFSKQGRLIYLVSTIILMSREPYLSLSGNGIINADGELWKVQRKAGLNFLNTANLKVLTDIALPQYLKENVLALSNLGNKTVVDLQDVFNELTTLLMGKMAYDVCILYDYISGTSSLTRVKRWRCTTQIHFLKPSKLLPLRQETDFRTHCGK